MNRLFWLLITIFSFWSCSLDEELLDSSTGEDLIDQVAEQLVNDPEGAAIPILNNVLQSVTLWNPQDGLYALTEHPSDEMQGPTRGTDWDDGGVWRVLHTHSWDENNPFILNTWNGLNTGVARSFDALNTFELAAETSPEAGESLAPFIAEIRFLRAWFMWNIMDLWGQTPSLDENQDPIVLQRAEAAEFLIEELREIIPNLPEVGEVTRDRPTRPAGQLLLARILLNKAIYDGTGDFASSDMQEVVNLCDAIINSGNFSLADNYFDIFAPDNSTNASAQQEAIWLLPNSESLSNGPSNSRANMTLHYNDDKGSQALANQGAGAPWNGFATVAEFYDKWDTDNNISNGVQTNDVRFQDFSLEDEIGGNLGFLVGEQTDFLTGQTVLDRLGNVLNYSRDVPLSGADESQGVRVLKYRPDPDSPVADLGDNDQILFRYADVVLMKAEALWRSGGDGLSIINQLRTARGADPIQSISPDGTEILDERGFELYWEGYRRTDQIRFGTFLGTWQNKPNPSDPSRVLFTIPQQALDVNPLLVQNR